MKLTVLLALMIIAAVFAFGLSQQGNITGSAVSLTDPAKLFSYFYHGLSEENHIQNLCSETNGIYQNGGCSCPYGEAWNNMNGCVIARPSSAVDVSTAFTACAVSGGVWTPISDFKGMGVKSRESRSIALLKDYSDYCDCPAPLVWNTQQGCVKRDVSKEHAEIMCLLTKGTWTTVDLTRLSDPALFAKAKKILLMEDTVNGFCLCQQGMEWGTQFKQGCSDDGKFVNCNSIEGKNNAMCLARELLG